MIQRLLLRGRGRSVDYERQLSLSECANWDAILPSILRTILNQRTNGLVNAHPISGPSVGTKTSFANFDIVLKWVKVNSGSLFI